MSVTFQFENALHTSMFDFFKLFYGVLPHVSPTCCHISPQRAVACPPLLVRVTLALIYIYISYIIMDDGDGDYWQRESCESVEQIEPSNRLNQLPRTAASVDLPSSLLHASQSIIVCLHCRTFGQFITL